MGNLVYAATVGSLVLAYGCSGESGEAGDGAVADQGFTVWLDSSASEKEVTQAILAAAHVQLAAVCNRRPDGVVRIYHPLAASDVEISCSAVLDTGETTAETGESLVTVEGGEHVGEAQEPLSRYGLACWAASTALYYGGKHYCRKHRERREDRENCEDMFSNVNTAIGIICIII
jgi:hypothetical protein